jgi:hypothetical protein
MIKVSKSSRSQSEHELVRTSWYTPHLTLYLALLIGQEINVFFN